MSGRWIAVIVGVLVVLCLVVGALAALWYWVNVPTAEAAVKPVVVIDSPSHGDEVIIGQPVQILATGQDPGKIATMQVWVDGGMLVSQDSALPGGTSPFPIMALWAPETPGNHTIVVRAYNMADDSGQASISVIAAEGPAVPEGCEGVAVLEHEVQPGETVEGIASGYEVTVDQIVACNPGLDPTVMPTAGDILLIPGIVDPAEEGPPADFPPPPDAEEPPDVPEDVEELPGEELPPAEEEPAPGEEAPPEVEEPPEGPEVAEPPEPEVPTVILGFEALEFEVDQPYDDIYCMVQLSDASMERVPETGSFSPVGGNYWDIQAELAGANSRMVPVQGDTFRIEAECFGWTGIDGWSLGHFVREHGDAEWTGEEIEVTAIADDGRWFRVVYRICPDFPCEPRPVPDAPENLTYLEICPCAPFPGCPPCPELRGMAWEWAGEEAGIDGFRLYRNDAMLYEQLPHLRGTLITQADAYPPCGEVYDYEVTAYRGFPGVGPESDPSNTVTRTGPACTTTVVVTFETLHTGCIKADPCGDPSCASCYVPNWMGAVAANDQYFNRLWPLGAPDIGSYTVLPVADLFDGNDTLTVELDPGEDLTIQMLIIDWDPGWSLHPLLYGSRTVASADVATGDYWMIVQSTTPGEGFGIVVMSLEVLP